MSQNALLEQSAILSTFITLQFVVKTFVLVIFKWPLETGFTVFLSLNYHLLITSAAYIQMNAIVFLPWKQTNMNADQTAPKVAVSGFIWSAIKATKVHQQMRKHTTCCEWREKGEHRVSLLFRTLLYSEWPKTYKERG